MDDLKTCHSMDVNSSDNSDDEIEVKDPNDSQKVKCIFSDAIYPSASKYFLDLKCKKDFDIWQITRSDLMLDFFGYVKLINYMRKKYSGMRPPTCLELQEERKEWDKDEYLKPAIPEDPLLQFMIDDDDTDSDGCPSEVEGQENDINYIKQKLLKAEETNGKLTLQLQDALSQISQMKSFMQDIVLTGDVGMYRPVAACRQGNRDYEEEYEDSGYFGTYAHHDIHAEMLQDTVRTSSYRDVILKNADQFRDKIVLDVGCGTGILSMFAAQAGAKHVYGVDMSEIAFQAMDIVKENGLEGRITIFKGRIEEIDLPVEKVDIIISEWMGYFLLYESMLDSVLFARDKWLAPGGELYPNYCTISLLAVHDEKLASSNVTFWNNVYGFKMSSLQKQVLSEVAIQVLNATAVLSEPVVVHTIDLRTVTSKELDYKADFNLKVTKSGPFSAVLGYFDIFQCFGDDKFLMFSTSPVCKPTHWKQAVFFLGRNCDANKGDIVSGQIDCHKNVKDPRSLVISMSVNGEKRSYKIE